MKTDRTLDQDEEVERYELTEGPAYRFDIDRRDFLKVAGTGAAVALVIGGGPGTLRAQESGGPGRGKATPEDQVSTWLHIDEEGGVTVYTGKVEVGQNVRTSLAQAVADELRIPMESIQMVMGDTDLTPYDRGTFGSRSTPTMAPRLRRAAAAGRDLLMGLAAEKLTADRTSLTVADGRITDLKSGRSVGYGDLTQGQPIVRVIPEDQAVNARPDWTVAGHTHRKVTGRAIVTGAHRYPSDLRVSGMLHGKVLRPPAFGATLVSLEGSKAEGMAGVTVVRDGNFVGVTAPDPETAERALLALKAAWNRFTQTSRPALFDHLKSTAQGDLSADPAGPVGQALSGSHRTLAQTYTVDYIAHTPLEPRAALAEWSNGRITVSTGTQRPFGVRSELAKAFRIPEDHVHVLMPDMGSGYGGKHTGDAAVEAARLAKAVGKPVKLVWTREEEFTWAYFRPAGVIDISSGIDADGKLKAWEYHNVNSGRSGIRVPYAVPVQKTEFHRADSPLRQGSYRALASTANIFAIETHIDELARLADSDPLAFRLQNLENERLRGVFQAAAERFGWAEAKPGKNRGVGIAGGTEKGGCVATCAEVEVNRKSGDLTILRVVEAFECGAIVNPDQLKNQIEGCIVQGLGGALFESIDFADGRVLNPSFSSYRVPRFGDVPPIEVVLVDRKDLPSAGGGETPICGIAPAIGNAIFDAVGVRLRSLPLIPNGLKL